MGKIVINKNFNTKYLFRYAQSMFYPLDTTRSISHINYDTAAGTTAALSTFREVFLTKQSTLPLLEKISRHYNSIDIPLVATDVRNCLGFVLETLIFGTVVNKATVKAHIVAKGILTQEEVDSLYINILNDRPVINTTVSSTGLMTLSITNPNKLSTRYNKDFDNLTNEQLYVCFPVAFSQRFGGINTSYTAIENIYFASTGSVIKQGFTYVAVSIGTTGSEDIVMDYTDVIDYLDDIDIRVQLPKQVM